MTMLHISNDWDDTSEEVSTPERLRPSPDRLPPWFVSENDSALGVPLAAPRHDWSTATIYGDQFLGAPDAESGLEPSRDTSIDEFVTRRIDATTIVPRAWREETGGRPRTDESGVVPSRKPQPPTPPRTDTPSHAPASHKPDATARRDHGNHRQLRLLVIVCLAACFLSLLSIVVSAVGLAVVGTRLDGLVAKADSDDGRGGRRDPQPLVGARHVQAVPERPELDTNENRGSQDRTVGERPAGVEPGGATALDAVVRPPTTRDLLQTWGNNIQVGGAPESTHADPEASRRAQRLFRRGIRAHRRGSRSEAHRFLRRSVRLDSSHPGALLGLAKIETLDSRHGQAAALLNRFHDVHAATARSLALRGDILAAVGEPMMARAAYEAARERGASVARRLARLDGAESESVRNRSH